MAALNRDACRAMLEADATAATDITGYGLLGHLTEMLRAGHVGASISVASVPVLADARALAADGVVPGGTRKNLAAVADMTAWQDVADADRLVLADAQTSGGLLIAVPAANRDRLLGRLRELGTPAAAAIGVIEAREGLRISP
jgi:selenide,water dikinase